MFSKTKFVLNRVQNLLKSSYFLNMSHQMQHPRMRHDNVEIINIDMDANPQDEQDLCITPVTNSMDINPWVDERALKHGTVDMDLIEQYYKDELPLEKPAFRSGLYSFQGIKINMPQKTLGDATYRYHYDGETPLPDDTRICKFD